MDIYNNLIKYKRVKMDLEIANRVWGEEWTLDISLIDDVIHQLNIVENSKVIDIGTGAGVMSVSLALNGFDVLTGEPEGEYEEHHEHEYHLGHGYPDWKEAAKAFRVEHKIRYQHLNAEHLTFPNESFDGVFLYDTLHHIENKEAALNECLRVIKSHKVVCIIEMNENGNIHFQEKHDFPPEIMVDPRDFIGVKGIVSKVIPGEYSDAYFFKKE